MCGVFCVLVWYFCDVCVCVSGVECVFNVCVGILMCVWCLYVIIFCVCFVSAICASV